MFDVVKLKFEDLVSMAEEPANLHVKLWLETGKAKDWADSSEAFSGFVNGELMICVGITQYWPGRAHIWSIFSERAGGCFVAVFRGMRKFMERNPHKRVEMDVPLGMTFTELAHRRALLLGFKLECPRAEAYRPDGGASALYSWTRGS